MDDNRPTRSAWRRHSGGAPPDLCPPRSVEPSTDIVPTPLLVAYGMLA